MNPNVAKIGRQLREIWKQLGTNQRVSVVLATAATFLGILAVAWWSGRAEYSLLYGKLSDGEASRVIAALDDAKVAYKVGAGGGSILVPSEKVHLVRMQLAGKGIPRSDGVGFEIFDKPNFGISDFVQRANYVRALQGELARTIAQIDEVESARVMVVLPENRLLLDKDKHATASVFIRLRGNTQLQPQAVSSIRFLVANSVEGLKPNFVSIVDNQGNVLSENVENDSLVGLSATQLDARRNLERYLARNAEGMLEKVLGPGQAIVRVAAELNFDSTQRTEKKFDPDGQVARLTTKETSTDDSTTANGGEVAGVSANTPGSSAGTNAASPLTNSKNKKITDTTQYEVSETTSTVMQAAGGIKHLSAAVTVAAKVEGTGSARKIVNRSDREINQLSNIVSSALGIKSTRGDEIKIEELPFNDQFATEVAHHLETQDRRDFWWTIARNLAYPALALGILFVFIRLFKRTTVEDIQRGAPAGRLPLHLGNGHGNGRGALGLEPRPEPPSGVVTVEVLNQLIKENPQNMTQAIRGWLDRGETPPSS